MREEESRECEREKGRETRGEKGGEEIREG